MERPRNEVTAERTESGSQPSKDAVTEIAGSKRAEADELRRGSTVGRYVVLGRLGAGGMGVVYTSYDPELDRKVAVKVLRHTADKHEDAQIARTRFLREAQSMAKLQHGNVAAIYDVGTHADSVFIAMEFVDGLTLRKWLDINGPAWRKVLPAFMQAGRGLMAAHAAGIIHRDFKPENVMMDADNRAVVLDFGLARPRGDYNTGDTMASASGSGSSLDVMLTTTGTVMGTPFYMAPEQHRGASVDERTDQFAFCVALYEALYERRPFVGRSAKELAAHVVKGRLRPPPKSKVPGRIQRAVLRGLQTAPADRHPTMDALLAELRRPQKRRGRVALGAIAVAALSGAAGSVFISARRSAPCRKAAAPVDASWGKIQKRTIHEAFRPHTKADGEATFDRAEAEMDAYADAWSAARKEACKATRVRDQQSEEVLELRYACLDRSLRKFDALVEVLSEADTGVVFGAVRMTHELPPIEDCADVQQLRKRIAPPDGDAARREVAAIRDRLSVITLWADAGELDRVESELQTLKNRVDVVDYPPLSAELNDTMAKVYAFTGRVDQSVAAAEEALLIGMASGHDGAVFDALMMRAVVAGNYRSRFDEADVYLKRAAAVLERMGGGDARQASLDLATARIFVHASRDEEALERYEAVLASIERLGTQKRPVSINALSSYGIVLLDLGREEEAREALDKAIELAREALGGRHPEVAVALLYQARAMSSSGEEETALGSIREAHDIFVASLGPEHNNALSALNAEALVLDHLGRLDAAAEVFETMVPIARAKYGKNLNLAAVLQNAGSLLTRLGRAEEGLVLLQETLEIKEEALGKDDEELGYTSDLVGEALIQLGQLEEAEAALRRSKKILMVVKGLDDPVIGRPIAGLGEIALARGRHDEAKGLFERSRELIKPDDEDRAPARARASFGLARVLAAAGNQTEARALAKDAQAAFEAARSEAGRLAVVTRWLEDTG